MTRTAHVDSMSLSATNAAGGTRVIGVGCRYYTTLRRGVFILPSGSHRELDRTTFYGDYTIFAIYAICVGLWWSLQINRGLYHLCK